MIYVTLTRCVPLIANMMKTLGQVSLRDGNSPFLEYSWYPSREVISGLAQVLYEPDWHGLGIDGWMSAGQCP